MTTEQNERVFTVTVKGKEEQYNADGDRDFKITADCPAMKSKYPMVFFVPEDVGESLPGGKPVDIVFRAQGKVKDEYDGQQPWMWKWRFIRTAEHGEAPQPAPTTTQRHVDVPTGADVRIDGMKWGNCLNNAAAAMIAYPDLTVDELFERIVPLAARLYTVSLDDIQQWAQQ